MEDNRIVLSPFDTKTSMSLAKVQYDLKTGSFRPFVALGLGQNTYFTNINDAGVDKVRRANFAAMPEVGIKIDDLSLSAKYLLGGRGPSFSGIGERGEEMVLESEIMSILYFTLGYSFHF